MHRYMALGEGVLLRGLNLDALIQAEDRETALSAAMQKSNALLGATKSGCIFRCETHLLDVTRGHRTPAVGELLQGPWEVSLTGTLLEISPENAAMLLHLPIFANNSYYTSLSAGNAAVPVPSTDICWVGAQGGGLLAISLTAPVSAGGLTLKACRNGLGEMPFALCAQHRDPAETGAPCRLVWLKEVPA